MKRAGKFLAFPLNAQSQNAGETFFRVY